MIVKRRSRSGFTLIELLLVVGILGILSVIGLSTFSTSVVRGKDTRRKNDLSQLSKALEAYAGDFGVYPDGISGVILGCTAEGSEILKACPIVQGGRFQRSKNVGGEIENIVYLDIFPTDPDADKRYYYINTTAGGISGFALYAALENSQDKDVKRIDGDPDPDGWGVEDGAECGNPSGTPYCNYKVTSSGVVRSSPSAITPTITITIPTAPPVN